MAPRLPLSINAAIAVRGLARNGEVLEEEAGYVAVTGDRAEVLELFANRNWAG